MRDRDREFAVAQDERNDVAYFGHVRPGFGGVLCAVIEAAAFGQEDQSVGGADFVDRFARDVAAL
jgi:hypothetical protein